MTQSIVPFSDWCSINSDGPNTNYKNPELYSGHAAPNKWRILLLPDFANADVAIPANAIIDDATLRINQIWEGATSQQTKYIYMFIESWLGSQATYNNRLTGTAWTGGAGAIGGDSCEQTNMGSLTFAADESMGVKSFPLTAAKVQEWTSGATTNNGFIIKTRLIAEEESGDAHGFDSPSGATPPDIVVNWHVDPTFAVAAAGAATVAAAITVLSDPQFAATAAGAATVEAILTLMERHFAVQAAGAATVAGVLTVEGAGSNAIPLRVTPVDSAGVARTDVTGVTATVKYWDGAAMQTHAEGDGVALTHVGNDWILWWEPTSLERRNYVVDYVATLSSGGPLVGSEVIPYALAKESDIPAAPNNAGIALILEDTGTTLPALIAALNNLSEAGVLAQAIAALDTAKPADPTADSAYALLESAAAGGGDDSVWTEEEKDQVIAKTGQIGALAVTITSPVNQDGNIEIVRGDDYLIADGRSFDITIEGKDYTGATAKLTVEGVLELTADAVVADGDTMFRFEATADDTNELDLVTYRFDVEVTTADNSIITPQAGKVIVVEDITRPVES